MTVDASLTAFSNMPELESSLLPNGKRRIKFMDSPKMSTYLLAFCVGEFDFVQCISDHGVVIRVYTPPGKADHGMFSLECAKRSLDYFDDFFNVPYPLPKLDMVGIPEFAMVSACSRKRIANLF
jgi:puromycin-sensitive aminopeptidase